MNRAALEHARSLLNTARDTHNYRMRYLLVEVWECPVTVQYIMDHVRHNADLLQLSVPFDPVTAIDRLPTALHGVPIRYGSVFLREIDQHDTELLIRHTRVAACRALVSRLQELPVYFPCDEGPRAFIQNFSDALNHFAEHGAEDRELALAVRGAAQVEMYPFAQINRTLYNRLCGVARRARLLEASVTTSSGPRSANRVWSLAYDALHGQEMVSMSQIRTLTRKMWPIIECTLLAKVFHLPPPLPFKYPIERHFWHHETIQARQKALCTRTLTRFTTATRGTDPPVEWPDD